MSQEITSVEATVELNDKDRRNAMIYNLFFRRKWVAPYVGIFLLFCIGIIFTALIGIFNVPSILLYASGGLLFLFVFFFISIHMSSKGATTTRKITFTEKGLTTSAGRDNKTISFKYQDMFYMGKTKNYFYYYLDASQFIIVPKRYLKTEEIEWLTAFI